MKIDSYLVRAVISRWKIVGLLICQRLPSPHVIWNLWLWTAIMVNLYAKYFVFTHNIHIKHTHFYPKKHMACLVNVYNKVHESKQTWTKTLVYYNNPNEVKMTCLWRGMATTHSMRYLRFHSQYLHWYCRDQCLYNHRTLPLDSASSPVHVYFPNKYAFISHIICVHRTMSINRQFVDLLWKRN